MKVRRAMVERRAKEGENREYSSLEFRDDIQENRNDNEQRSDGVVGTLLHWRWGIRESSKGTLRPKLGRHSERPERKNPEWIWPTVRLGEFHSPHGLRQVRTFREESVQDA